LRGPPAPDRLARTGSELRWASVQAAAEASCEPLGPIV